jgi:hypothetical protein
MSNPSTAVGEPYLRDRPARGCSRRLGSGMIGNQCPSIPASREGSYLTPEEIDKLMSAAALARARAHAGPEVTDEVPVGRDIKNFGHPCGGDD